MSEEPKKISFGFSKVSKKNAISKPKENESNKDVQFIDCLEEKSIKLVSGSEENEKPLPVITMLNGNLLRDNIKEVIKSRKQNNGISNSALTEKDQTDNPLTLDELATKEILDDLKKHPEQEKDENSITIPANKQVVIGEQNQSTLEDYESMPIADFGLAMLRGMGWDPKKGIGLNEKIVSAVAPTLRPKGMGLGADKVPAHKNVTASGEVLMMKKNAPIKVITGPYNSLYGKIEGFDELPGRIMVRLASNNVVVSLNEIMVQLVSLTEFNKNLENPQMENEKIKGPANFGLYQSKKSQQYTTPRENLAETNRAKIGSSSNKKEFKEKYKIKTERPDEHIPRKYERKVEKQLDTDSDEDRYSRLKNRIEERKKVRSPSSSNESRSSDRHPRTSGDRKREHISKHKERRYKEMKREKRRSSSSSSERSRRMKKSNKKGKHEKYSSSDSDRNTYSYSKKKIKKGRRSSSSDSYRTESHSRSHRNHKK